MADPKFDVELRHGGQFLKGKFGNEYLGGRTMRGLQFDLDHWSLQEITAILKELGYKGYVKIWYWEPGRCMNYGLKELKTDYDFMAMAKFVLSTVMKHVEVFVVHGYNEGNGVELTPNDPVPDYVPSEDSVGSDDSSSDESAEAEPVVVNANVEAEGAISDGYESEALYSMDGSSDDEPSKPKNLLYNPVEMCMDYKWKVGTEFSSIDQFKEAMKEWTLLNGRDIRYVKNDKIRCRVKCVGEFCEWMAFVSKVGDELTYRLKTYTGVHTCGRTLKEYLTTSNWVAEELPATRSSRAGTIIRCSRCKQMGHNRATCKQPATETQGGSGAQPAAAGSGSQAPATAPTGVGRGRGRGRGRRRGRGRGRAAIISSGFKKTKASNNEDKG